ncbi:MAG: RIP metalloprotease RseP [Bacteroides sp. SM23_62_1]|nr:MAG: RIP metalloprotease RseP [Bacteroides sp. SM23_62_1]
MKILIQASQLLLSLSILVMLHELGHFLFARLFKTRVEKFYIFFNPWFALFKRKIGETEFGIGWLPLGGYVKISGMIDESLDKEQLKRPPQPWEFRSKPAWQRLFIMVGGVLVNFLLALFIFATTLYIWGEQYLPTKNLKYGIMCDSLALSIGLQNGDKIISLDNQEVEKFNMIIPDMIINKASSIQVERNGQILDIPIPDEIIAPLLKSPAFIETRIPFYVDYFPKNSPAEESGIKKNDQIVGLNEKDFFFFDEISAELAKFKNQPIDIKVKRDGEILNFPVRVSDEGKIGIYPVGDYGRFFELEKIEYSFLAAVPAGISKGFTTMVSYLKQLKLLFRPKTKAYESLGGFLKIGSFFPDIWDWEKFWNLTALLSIILAVMNILPIPALDGGHVLFLTYEIISGRKPGDKFLEYAQIAGMIILLALLLYANGNDVIQLFRR